MPYVFNPFTGSFDDTVPLSGGKISANYLPSYVDDVLEVANLAALPATGEAGKIYITLDDNNTYRWSGSQYVLVGPEPPVVSVNGETGAVSLNVNDLDDYNLRLVPNATGGRWNTQIFSGLPTAGQFRQSSSTTILVGLTDSLGNANIATIFPTGTSETIWLSSDGINWVQRTSSHSLAPGSYHSFNLTSGSYTVGSTLYVERFDPTSGPATLPLANRNVLAYNSATQKWEPTPVNADFLSDVDTTTATPTNGQALAWNGSNFVPTTVVRPTDSINVLADVDTATAAPTNGQLLTWDSADSRWEPGNTNLDALTDTDLEAQHTAPFTDGSALIFANGKWQAGPVIGGYSYSTGNDPLAASVVYGNSFNVNFLDESGYWNQVSKTLIVTQNGSTPPVISTADKKYGTGSYFANANGAYTQFTSTNDSAAFSFGTGDFCIEGWFRDIRGFGARGLFYLAANTNMDLVMNSAGFLTSSVGLSSNTVWPGGWVHVALTRQNGLFRLFQNGVLVGSITPTARNFTGNFTFSLGYANPVSPYFWWGYIDDLRITKGAARYTANFTPPTGAILGEQVIGAYTINNLSDVDTATAVPTNGQTLAWNGTNWVPRTAVLSTTTGITGASAVTNCISLSQANYDAIAVKDPNTLYVIV